MSIIEVKNVSFSYKNVQVLSNLNMKLEGTKTYALVGHNGAGKSTIIKLLLRFYDPTEGEILLNGKNIKEYNLQKYRALFATAFQDNKLFSMSVTDNVLLGEEVEESQKEQIASDALKLSGVYEKISSLEKGMNTTLTKEFDDEGVVFSGGEFQKVVVARAFAKNCPIKVFDEPSSALDPIAEYELNKAMETAAKGKTVFYISHRLSTTRDADRIIMLEKGQIIEEGTHAQLLAQNGKYAQMWHTQAGNYN
jgi:ATP-binding cassette subfamily B protein